MIDYELLQEELDKQIKQQERRDEIRKWVITITFIIYLIFLVGVVVSKAEVPPCTITAPVEETVMSDYGKEVEVRYYYVYSLGEFNELRDCTLWGVDNHIIHWEPNPEDGNFYRSDATTITCDYFIPKSFIQKKRVFVSSTKAQCLNIMPNFN